MSSTFTKKVNIILFIKPKKKKNLFFSYNYLLEKETLDVDLLKLVEEIIENSYSIIYRLAKLVEEFRSHISKCKGRYDVIVQKIQKLEFNRSNS